MNRYFYTFGSDPGFPYQNGWVEIHADSLDEADKKFRNRFPDRPGHEGIGNPISGLFELYFYGSDILSALKAIPARFPLCGAKF